MFIQVSTIAYALFATLATAKFSCNSVEVLQSFQLDIEFVQPTVLGGIGDTWVVPFDDLMTLQLNDGDPIEDMCLYLIRYGPEDIPFALKIALDPQTGGGLSDCEVESEIVFAHGVVRDHLGGSLLAYVTQGTYRWDHYQQYTSLPGWKENCENPNQEILGDEGGERAKECDKLFDSLHDAMRWHTLATARSYGLLNINVNIKRFLFGKQNEGPPDYTARYFGKWDVYIQVPRDAPYGILSPFFLWTADKALQPVKEGLLRLNHVEEVIVPSMDDITGLPGAKLCPESH